MMMKLISFIIPALILCISFPASAIDPVDLLPDYVFDQKKNPYPLNDKVHAFLKNQETLNDFKPSGLSGQDYLKLIARQVEAFSTCQDSTGAIIDPVYKIEWQYSTPCYALSVALLYKTGYIRDKNILHSGIKALNWSVKQMCNYKPAQNHGEFYIQPVMVALKLLDGIAPDSCLKIWKKQVSGIDPYLLYHDNLKKRQKIYNHNVVALAGEIFRIKEYLNPDIHFFETHLENQMQYLSANGLYIDNPTNPPMAYDEFTRQFLSSILMEGYQGKCIESYKDMLWRGAWTSLFMQSPFGEVPTGGRSAQHLWNEAAAAVTYETYATQCYKRGMLDEAGAFKRAAHLSLQSIMRWKREDGSGFIVKNRFPIEVMHGYESYSGQSQYNLLTCWLMAMAYLYSDDVIPEKPAPADVGGFVIVLQDVFHKVIANASGCYVEYDFSADPRYNATGLIRVHIKGSNPQIGPSDGVPHKWDNKAKKDLGGELMAVGPAWFDKQGNEHRLAEYTNTYYPNKDLYSAYTDQENLPEIRIKVLNEKSEYVHFEITYQGNFGTVEKITQNIQVQPDVITINDRLTGDISSMRIYFPMLIFDGLEHSKVKLSDNKLSLFQRDGEITFEALDFKNIIRRTGKELTFRNGMAEGAYFDCNKKETGYKIYVSNK